MSSSSDCRSSSSDFSSTCKSSSTDKSSSSTDSSSTSKSSSTDTSTDTKSLSSDSSSSESYDFCADRGSHDKHYNEKVYKKYLEDLRTKEPLSASDIFYQKQHAIVTVQSSSNYTATDGTAATSFDYDTGFFASPDGYIITAAGVLLFNTLFGTRDPLPPSPPGPTFVANTNIYVHVRNVNGKEGENYIYQAEIVGIDGAANVGVIRVNPLLQFNTGLPKIKCQEYLRFGKSRCYGVGRKIYIFNSLFGDVQPSITEGVVSNNRQFSVAETAPPVELVTVNVNIPGSVQGGPVLNEYGLVIGLMSTSFTSFGSSGYGAVSENFLKPILTAFMDPKKYRCHLELVQEVNFSYYRYLKGFLGISWTSFDSLEFIMNPSPLGYRRSQGLLVSGILTDTDLGAQLLPLVDAGYTILITDIDCEAVGNIIPQITPALITWCKVPGDTVKITFRSSSDNFSHPETIEVRLARFPPALDLPNTNFMAPAPPASAKDEKYASDPKAMAKIDKKAAKAAAKISGLPVFTKVAKLANRLVSTKHTCMVCERTKTKDQCPHNKQRIYIS